MFCLSARIVNIVPVVGDKDVNDGAVVVNTTVVVLASMKNTSCY